MKKQKEEYFEKVVTGGWSDITEEGKAIFVFAILNLLSFAAWFIGMTTDLKYLKGACMLSLALYYTTMVFLLVCFIIIYIQNRKVKWRKVNG